VDGENGCDSGSEDPEAGSKYFSGIRLHGTGMS
jgi:hypothetical protein